MSTYRHQPLQGARKTRLMWLEPSARVYSPLQCRLIEVSLDHMPQYEALSYSWEAHKGDGNILCFNMPFKITSNCEAALFGLRLLKRPRVLWVDAICIDQESNQDKEAQIPLIKDIYSMALEVILWLGPSSFTSHRAFRALKKYGREYGQFDDENSDVSGAGLQYCGMGCMSCIAIILIKDCLGIVVKICELSLHDF
jgi:hypothetical protein